MRVVAGLLVHEVSNDDHLPVRRPRCGEELGYPGIVIRAVIDHDPRGREVACDRRTRFKEMRILIWVAEDACDLDFLAPDQGGQLAVEVLGRDDRNRPVNPATCALPYRGQTEQEHCYAERPSHGGASFDLSPSHVNTPKTSLIGAQSLFKANPSDAHHTKVCVNLIHISVAPTSRVGRI